MTAFDTALAGALGRAEAAIGSRMAAYCSIANAVGVSRRTVERWAAGHCRPAEPLAARLGPELETFLQGSK